MTPVRNFLQESIYRGSRTFHTGDKSILDSLLGLSSLKSLNVAGNRLAVLPDGLFLSLLALEELDLSGNSLKRLPAGIALCTQLRVLSLSNNPLSAVPRGIAELPHLEELCLRYE